VPAQRPWSRVRMRERNLLALVVLEDLEIRSGQVADDLSLAIGDNASCNSRRPAPQLQVPPAARPRYQLFSRAYGETTASDSAHSGVVGRLRENTLRDRRSRRRRATLFSDGRAASAPPYLTPDRLGSSRAARLFSAVGHQ
jgi:hypothetical protein